MLDIFLHKYNPTDNLSAYTAPQKFRSALGLGANQQYLEDVRKTWHSGKSRVLKRLTSRIRNQFNCDGLFGFALAPSNTRLFYDDMLSFLKNEFQSAIDFSSCFAKIGNGNALNVNRQLSESELRQRYSLNHECFRSMYNDKIEFIILVDDVYSIGNTFNGMTLLINDIFPNLNIKKAVILTTNE